ncbi:MAG: uroporphyrinogen-III synthase [Pseudomonadota bacterium]|jgi:uroporphyrinogen-III synthase
MASLNGLRVLITRPMHQAHSLIEQIQKYEGIAVHFPTLDIIPSKNIKKIELSIKKLNQYDFVIFISPNSAYYIAKSIHRICSFWPKNLKILATGPGTALALTQCDLPCHEYPKNDFSGKGILKLATLQNVNQKKFLIIKGEGGRAYLAESLKARGAQVDNLNVYKRQLPKIDKSNIPNQKSIDIIICTSHSGLKNLVSLLYPYWQASLLKKQLLVISTRLQDSAKKLGFVKTPLISDNATNTAILNTLFSWREQSLWNHNPHSS